MYIRKDAEKKIYVAEKLVETKKICRHKNALTEKLYGRKNVGTNKCATKIFPYVKMRDENLHNEKCLHEKKCGRKTADEKVSDEKMLDEKQSCNRSSLVLALRFLVGAVYSMDVSDVYVNSLCATLNKVCNLL